MSRWHKETCSKPRVVIAGNTPRCEACDSVPDIQRYIAQQNAIPAFTQPPPDPPLGQLNLRWPSSVKYKQQTTSIVQLGGDPLSNKPKIDAFEPGDNKKVTQSPIYSSRLGQEEFRLLFLSPSTDPDTPIHAELVVHQDGRSPQYESTSYTWAGEDDDSSKCRPLYIGRYWDIVLQTRNCWSMLQSLRLPIGTRAVWVDAICINQNDIKERDSQVMKMSQRYKNCYRVVVYLGPDMATSIQGSYPAQKELTLSNSEQSMGISRDSFRKLLCRRYFSRIWVVQELVLARRVAFQIGDSEYWMDSNTMRSLEAHTNWDWNSTTAPWLQNVGLERLQETNILHILRATHMCQCADPRDRVFGILSLLSNNSSDSILRADYSLSFREMVIGLFSHTLLELRDLGVLRFAAGLRNYFKFPSWMPNLELFASDVSTRDVLDELAVLLKDREMKPENELQLASCHGIVGDGEVDHRGTPWYLDTTVDSSTGTLSINLIHLLEFQNCARKMGDVEIMKGWHLFTIPGRHSNLVLSSNLPLDELIVPTRDHLFCLNDGNGSPIFLLMSLEIDHNTYKVMGICRHVAFQDQKLDLRENIQQWNASETRYTSGDNGNLHFSEGKSEDQNLHLRSLQYTLHNQLEAISTDDTSTNIWTDNPSRLSSLKARLGFGRGSNYTFKPILMNLINEHVECGLLACLSLGIPTSFRPQVEVGKYIVVTVTKNLFEKLDLIWWKSIANNWRFVGQACFESSPDKDCSCWKAFDNTGLVRHKEQLQNMKRNSALVDLLSKISSREEVRRGSSSVSDHCMLWQDYTDPPLMWPHAALLGGLAVQIRIPREAMECRIKQTMAWKTLHRLNRVSPISNPDDLDAVLGNPNPNPDFRSIAVPGWPTELVDDFNIDGSVQRVCIQ
ncbi:uncharacterized protein FPRO_06625 [Fusarium proliferatum ET1]|uniref:Heterokaryon incompatibility domain-containing protein n=1 Tax=Fusarium proliferatum (strain ET1) TaxID=1227346 RepID=A0A1L7VD12_FUSPR|nr:uncharacterized protein FPRO_06625 [Fusarium proliferatum ET1]CZR38184.1 uncharacterized protein FPRO_06625 [Fusarium proliferatum ET1]